MIWGMWGDLGVTYCSGNTWTCPLWLLWTRTRMGQEHVVFLTWLGDLPPLVTRWETGGKVVALLGTPSQKKPPFWLKGDSWGNRATCTQPLWNIVFVQAACWKNTRLLWSMEMCAYNLVTLCSVWGKSMQIHQERFCVAALFPLWVIWCWEA